MTTMSRPDPLAPGTLLGPYEIVALIGAGGMGAVYRARDPRLGRDVALKVLPPAVATDPDRLARFETEARAVGRLEHPNVLVVYDVGRDGTIPYLVTELLEGETLGTRLQGGPLPVRKAVEYAAQVARGLAAAHAKGIIHRDLKPENLFLTTDDRVKILDFGLAKLAVPLADAPTAPIAPQTDAGIVLGTVGYMSPEQVRGETLDARTDIFSLGAVTHEMLGGTRAFSRSTSIETMNAILKEDAPDLPPSVPAGLDRLVRRCLEKRREDRFHSAHDLSLALEAQSMTGDRTSSIAPLAAPRVWTRRRAIGLGAGGLGLLALGAGAGMLIDRRTTPSYRRLTFRRGLIRSARFAPDGQTILYGALWDGEACRVYTVRTDSPESRPLDLAQANLLAISSKGEIALALGSHFEGIATYGTLARVPLAGGAPREILENVKFADWSPDGSELAIVRRVGGRDRLEFPVGNVLLEARGGGLGFMRVSPDGGRVAVISSAISGSVTVVDRAGVATPLTEEYRHIHGLAWNKEEIWYTAADDRPLFRSLHAVTLSGDRRAIAHVPGNATLHDVSRDGVVLLAHTDDRQGILALSPGATSERDLSWLDASALSDLSPDGRFILFTEFGQGGGSANSVYLRRTDGSAAVRLGDGRAVALSPDAKWALSMDTESYLHLLPTGAGEARRISSSLRYRSARWLPDSRRAVVHANEKGQEPRLYIDDLAGGVKPITPSGVGAWTPSPDGSTVAVRGADRAIRLYPVAGGEVRIIPGTAAREMPIAWITDGLLVVHDDAPGFSLKTIFRLNPATGQQALWKRIEPRDQAGLMFLYQFHVTPDGRSYAYSWHRAISDLYLVHGV